MIDDVPYSEAGVIAAYKAFRDDEAMAISRFEVERRIIIAKVSAAVYILPMMFLYIVGTMVAWVRRGFKNQR